jgi:hypothetical protein
MPESTLSIEYQDLAKDVSRLMSGGAVYATGTVTIAAGIVTLSSGTFPSWSSKGTVSYAGTLYTVNTRDSDTQVTLDDTSLTVAAASAYLLYRANGDTAADIEDVLQSGYRRFLYPPLTEGQEEPYRWSFLNPTATLQICNGTYSYNLPDDCGQDTADWTFEVGVTSNPLSLISEKALRSMRSQGNASGDPKYVAIRPIKGLASKGQRFEAIVYPTPNADRAVEYNYNIIPDKLDTKKKFPLGGAIHADTLRESCLAAAEDILDDEKGIHNAEFISRLSASISIDIRAGRFEAKPYRNTTVTYGTYDWFAQEVASFMDIDPNSHTWGHETEQKVDAIVQRGLQQFYHSPLPDVHHRWSFLRPDTSISTVASQSSSTVTIVDGVVTIASGTFPTWSASGELDITGVSYTVASYDSTTQITLDDTTLDASAGTTYELSQAAYDLPSDFGGMSGDMTYQPGGANLWPAINIVSGEEVRKLRQNWTTSTRPIVAGISPKTLDTSAGTQWEIIFYPSPDGVYKLTYRYRKNPAVLATTQYAAGGIEHAETILASCLEIASGSRADLRTLFLQKLKSSVDLDRMEMAPANLGYNSDRSDSHGGAYHYGRPIGPSTSYAGVVP